MLVTLVGIVTLVKLVQPENAEFPMSRTLLGIVMLVTLVQFWNAWSPMLVTLVGIVTLVRLVQPENASSPMLVTLLPIMTLVKLVDDPSGRSTVPYIEQATPDTEAEPLPTVGGGSYVTELVDIAGGRNVYGHLPAVSPTVSIEDLLRRRPQVILAGAAGQRHIMESAAWRAVPAVRAGRVLVVDTALVGRPGVRLGEGATHLARLLHPELAL